MSIEADDVAYIRILIGDSPANPADQLFTNTEIALFLRLENFSAKRAAANLLDAIAVNEVLLSKVIRTQDLSTDGSKVADSLRKQARVLRDSADDEETTLIVVSMEPAPRIELTEGVVWHA